MAITALTATLSMIPGGAAAVEATDVNSLGMSATYEVDATFGWDDRRVSVQTTAVIENTARWDVSTLAFNLATLRTGRAELGSTTVDGFAVEAVADDQTVIVPLPDVLAPTDTTTVEIAYTARLAANSSIDGDAWAFARIGDVLTAYRWIPWLTRTTPFSRPNVGDPFVTASSPSVRVTITTDREMPFATSGREVSTAGLTHTFEASDVRDFNLAASPSYRTRSVDVAGTTVSFYYISLPADQVLDVAARAIRDFSAKIAPFPHQQMTIAEVGPWSPFESPAHFWLPSNASARLLPWMVAHEVAHQWFYSAVGNDQAREPFSDEAVSDLMARTLISRFVSSQCPTGRLDHSIYDIGDCYAWVIYVQGVDWLRRVREAAGAERFWSALAAYYDDYKTRIGGTHALLSALASATDEAVAYDRFPRTFPARVVSMPFGPRLR